MSGATLDMLLHPPARLRIAALLSRVTDMEFAKLRELTEVSDSVLSKHLSALAEAGYVDLRKTAFDGRQRTWVALTTPGAKAFTGHLAALHELASGD
jgi:DNA-binding transcriptional ArsR family regulator